MKNKIRVKIIMIKRKCPNNYKIGDEVIIDENGVHGDICIHALYSLLPKAFSMLYNAEFHWLEDQNVATHACPDANNPVIFELKRVKQELCE
jgi:uncharacterized repeat protein (TIGR04076 family)